MDICDNKECTGCFACMNICPVKAITVGKDLLGKTIPVIDESICIKCNKCINVCQVINPIKHYNPKYVYAAWSQSESDQIESSSGGVAAVFAKHILDQRGVVYGAAFHEGRVKHIRVTTYEEARALKGSKYIQSDTSDVYQDIKKDLASVKQVLYIGLPCQIAGLLKFLGTGFENLITVDLVCHGVPPHVYFDDYLAFLNIPADEISFRHDNNYILTLNENGKTRYKQPEKCDLYFHAFLERLILRDNCYTCRFSSVKRIADISIGDFWGLNRAELETDYKGGISLVFVNTTTGENFWKMCQSQLIWEEKTISEAANPKQTSLIHPSLPHKDRFEFERTYINKGFIYSVKRTSVGKEVTRNKIKTIIKEIPGIKWIIKKLLT